MGGANVNNKNKFHYSFSAAIGMIIVILNTFQIILIFHPRIQKGFYYKLMKEITMSKNS